MLNAVLFLFIQCTDYVTSVFYRPNLFLFRDLFLDDFGVLLLEDGAGAKENDVAGVGAPVAGVAPPPKRLVPTGATAAAEVAAAVEAPKLNPAGAAGAGGAPKAGVVVGAPNAGAGVVPKPNAPKADGCTADPNVPDAVAGCACVEVAAA